MKRIAFVSLMLVMCAGVFAQKWVPLYEGSSVMQDMRYKYRKTEMKLNNGNLYRVSDWENYLKDFIFQFPETSRDSITDGLTRFYTDYDKVEKIIRFSPIRFLSGPYSGVSYISFDGYLENDTIYPELRLKYDGYNWLFIEGVKIVTDNNSYEIDVEDCYRDAVRGGVIEMFNLPYNDKNAKMIDDIITSEETIVRFLGKEKYSDFTVNKRMIDDMNAMVKAIKAIRNN